jgi:hypothetical protein
MTSLNDQVSKPSIALVGALIGALGLLPALLYWFAPSSSVEISSFPFRASPASEQWIAVIAAFIVKPIYMLGAFALIVILWQRRARDLVALRWSMIFFFVGETFCWINILFFDEQSIPLEYLHSYGMVLCLAFLTFALIEGMDRRIARFSDADAKCALLGLCRGCAKYKPVPCALHRLFALEILALAALAVMPLNVTLQDAPYTTRIFGVLHLYAHPIANQLYELRFNPAMAIVLLTVSLVLLQMGKDPGLMRAKIFFAAGVGFWGFAFLRLALFTFYRDNLVWFAFWEEATELILVASIGCVLWIFRAALWRADAAHE